MGGRCGGLLMKPLAVRFFNVVRIMLSSAVLWNSLTCNAYAQYSDNLIDILAQHWIWGHAWNGCHEPTPIGNLGNLGTVVDLRGFVPMAFASREATPLWNAQLTLATTGKWKNGDVHWYKIPTKRALLLLYFGDIPSTHLADDTTSLEGQRFRKTRFLKESDVNGETALWSSLAYRMAKDSEPLYQKIVGDNEFEGAEPTTVIFTDQSSFIVLSFRGKNAGQELIAMEFSRSSREYKTFYQLYSTVVPNKATNELIAGAAAFVGKELIKAGIQYLAQ
jgi:hypothetical protein